MDDKRLERLFDYTKFHIGVYISAGGALVTLLGFAASTESGSLVRKLVGSPIALVVSIVAMLLAGMAGGVIASACTECEKYEDLWRKKQGPYGTRWIEGRFWAAIEHSAFWIGVLAIAYCVLSAPDVRQWLRDNPCVDRAARCESLDATRAAPSE